MTVLTDAERLSRRGVQLKGFFRTKEMLDVVDLSSIVAELGEDRNVHFSLQAEPVEKGSLFYAVVECKETENVYCAFLNGGEFQISDGVAYREHTFSLEQVRSSVDVLDNLTARSVTYYEVGVEKKILIPVVRHEDVLESLSFNYSSRREMDDRYGLQSVRQDQDSEILLYTNGKPITPFMKKTYEFCRRIL